MSSQPSNTCCQTCVLCIMIKKSIPKYCYTIFLHSITNMSTAAKHCCPTIVHCSMNVVPTYMHCHATCVQCIMDVESALLPFFCSLQYECGVSLRTLWSFSRSLQYGCGVSLQTLVHFLFSAIWMWGQTSNAVVLFLFSAIWMWSQTSNTVVLFLFSAVSMWSQTSHSCSFSVLCSMNEKQQIWCFLSFVHWQRTTDMQVASLLHLSSASLVVRMFHSNTCSSPFHSILYVELAVLSGACPTVLALYHRHWLCRIFRYYYTSVQIVSVQND